MGSWNETCGVTNTPIRPGEPVYVVRINRNVKLYDRHFGDALSWPYLETIDKGTYDDYGWIEEYQDPDDCFYVEKDGRNIFVDERNRCYKIFVHESVWDRIQTDFESRTDARFKEMVEGMVPFSGVKRITEGPLPENWLEFANVVAFCSATRRDILCGHRFSGMQHYDPEEYRIVREETDRIMTAIEDDWRVQQDEEEMDEADAEENIPKMDAKYVIGPQEPGMLD